MNIFKTAAEKQLGNQRVDTDTYDKLVRIAKINKCSKQTAVRVILKENIDKYI